MKISINEQLTKKGISRYELAKRIGVSYPTVTSLYNGTSSSIKFEILENICKVLECTPNDIIATDDPQLKQLFAYHSKLSELTNNE